MQLPKAGPTALPPWTADAAGKKPISLCISCASQGGGLGRRNPKRLLKVMFNKHEDPSDINHRRLLASVQVPNARTEQLLSSNHKGRHWTIGAGKPKEIIQQVATNESSSSGGGQRSNPVNRIGSIRAIAHSHGIVRYLKTTFCHDNSPSHQTTWKRKAAQPPV